MGWITTAAIAAAMLPATGAAPQDDAARREREPATVGAWAAGANCREVLAGMRSGRGIPWCLPGDPLRLGSSLAWRPDGPRERPPAREPDWAGPRDDRPPFEDGPPFNEDRAKGGDGREACATGVEAGCAATVTPEPVTLVLLGSGLAGIAGASYRKRRRGSPPAPGDE